MMCATECPNTRQLRDLTRGRLATEESDDLLAHVNSCEACRAEIETVDDGEDSLIASLRAPGELDCFQNEPACDLALAKSLGALAETAESNADLLLPRQIGEYQIQRPLGRGGMGSVFLARHTKLGREVALKVLAHHRLGDARVRERFETEMRAIGRLSHPNIVTAHDAREIDGTAVLVTEFVDGFDLEQLIKRTGPLSFADACEIIRQTAVALEYTSSQGFVHRDVKPSNIVLGREGDVKLLDLGLARLQFGDADRPDMTGTGQAIGTADYIAPEQVTDSRSVDVRADIYSLGCTLFKLLTGAAPFSDDHRATAFAKMTAHVSTDAPSLSTFRSDAPRELVALVESMLAKDTESRPQTPSEVVQRMHAFTSGHDLSELIATAERSEPTAQAASEGSPAAGKRDLSNNAVIPEAHPIGSRMPQTQSFFSRAVPLSWLIATGVAAGLLGFALGVIVKITYPDGTTVSHKVVSGGKVEIVPEHEGVKGTRGSASDAALPTRSVQPAAIQASAQDRLQGRWKVLEALDGGRPGDVDGMQMTFSGDRYCLYEDPNSGHFQAGTFVIRGTDFGEVYELDLIESKDGRTKGASRTKRAMLRFIDHDRIQICLNERDDRRPTQFTSEPNSVNDVLITMARPGNQRQGDSPSGQGIDSDNQSEALRVSAVTQLQQLSLAMVHYESVHGHFPASARVERLAKLEKKTEPYSWRVAILPFIEEGALYEQYRFDEPWDSQHNRTLLEKMPEIFRSPFAPNDQKPGHTNYVGFAGDQTVMGEEQGVKLGGIKDGTSNTLLIVETKTTVPWTKPEDLAFEEPDDAKLAIPFPGEPIRCGMADGSVRSISSGDWRELAKQITRSDGERVRSR